uniref:L1 transposable element RRM domain-containing protein n=1 Tax=Felis catus TaxID=9685 RepID=A0ABI7Y930_FELCA
MEAATAWIEEAEGRIGELEDKIMEKEEAEKKRDKKIQEYERRIRELSDALKGNNIHIIGIPEEKEEREKGVERVLEQIIAEDFPDLGEETGIEIQEAQRTPFRCNLNRSAQPIIVKLAKYKDKDRILKAARNKRVLTYKGRHIRVVADLSTEAWQARKERQEIFNVMNREKHAAKNPLPSKSVIQDRRRDKGFPKQTKTEGIYHH